MGNSVRATFRVGGLWDSQGSKEIEHNLIQLDGVEEVQVSLENGTVEVRYDPAVIRREYLERTLNSPGYSPYVR
ncbi:Copper chaperone CopZ [Desulfofundulus australicus DSM 11792]|uniref:Copper chaperone CopZ n=1 Tax=Desulfofundulus australicus DSM 11792 TaxID=1121425 RepID=A0A1M4ZEC9_9FIRM|nr:heavy metal-associated domain-containing protein [Desulfofundulus australicus]SHF16167.1 Copper chaperone CopZ [Desulfofundulus australicus DSM 11792]